MSRHKRVHCFRFPCDTAWHRGTHVTDEDGRILHEVRWGNESRRAHPGEDAQFPDVWSIGTIAWDNEPWQPWIYVENGQRTFATGQEASLFVEKLVIAMACALDANVKDATERAEAAESLVEALER